MQDKSFHEIFEKILEKKNDFELESNATLQKNSDHKTIYHYELTIENPQTFSTSTLSQLNQLSHRLIQKRSNQKIATQTFNQHYVKQSLKIKTEIKKPHHFNKEQRQAYETLFYKLELPVLKAHILLPEHFTLTQLRRAYKYAARKHHPDTGGSHESFIEIKKSYDLLKQLVTTPE